MTLEQMIGFGLVIVVMSCGLLGSVLPGLPGAPLVLIAAIGHRLYFGQASASNAVLFFLVLLTLASLGFDYLATMLGARRMGATWRGVFGAILGGMVGLFFGPPGIFLGPFLGALLFELMGGQEFNEAARAGIGAMIGLVLGAAAKAGCCLAMILLFAFNVLTRAGASNETLAALVPK